MTVNKDKIKYYTLHNIDQLPQFHHLKAEEQFSLRVVGHVLPFRVNNYVANELIDWTNIPHDPMYQLTFMQAGMLQDDHFERMANALRREASKAEIQSIAREIRMQLNPHPAGQMQKNIPLLEEEPVSGIQHKYKETCLVFPRNAQTCHSYCTFCFRWPQFVGDTSLQFATDEARRFQSYIERHKEISDVLLTGGDPMVMNARNLSTYIDAFLDPRFEHISNIRIGTKSITYWPFKYLTDKDADATLRLFEKVVKSGKHLTIMAHVNHWIEWTTAPAINAIRRIRNTGAEIRTQSPLIKHINDDPDIWVRMWKEQVRLGCIPYYMFVERDTGSKHYFSVPLARAFEIYQEAIKQVSGLARTARGPSMSTEPGKIVIDGITTLNNERVFVLSFLQARNPELVKRPFFAKYDPRAKWLTDLRPAFGQNTFFFERFADRVHIPKRTRLRFQHSGSSN